MNLENTVSAPVRSLYRGKNIMCKGHSISGVVFLGAAMLAMAGTSAFAQVDFTGEYRILNHWDTLKRVPGPDIGDYTGLPLNDGARARADSWQASLWTVPEYQCMPHPSTYAERGFSGTNLKWWREVDPRTQKVVAERIRGTAGEPERWIWMDGRPHPPEYAARTWLGFSTGKWEGNTLVVETTHLKDGYVERNGAPQSDRAVVTENWVLHGNYLNEIVIINDPVYFTEPLVRSSAWVVDRRLQSGFARNPCGPQETTVEVVRPPGVWSSTTFRARTTCSASLPSHTGCRSRPPEGTPTRCIQSTWRSSRR
jgi:hypothetical protein